MKEGLIRHAADCMFSNDDGEAISGRSLHVSRANNRALMSSTVGQEADTARSSSQEHWSLGSRLDQ